MSLGTYMSIKLTDKVLAGATGVLIVGLAVPLTAAAATSDDADSGVAVASADESSAAGQSRYDACHASSDVLSNATVGETRESREARYECLHVGWPEWYDATPKPFELPADWQPDQEQLDWSTEFAAWLSGEMTEVAVAHTVVTNEDGAQWVDYDELDPVASRAVDEIIARGDHLPADSTVTSHLEAS